MKKEPSSAWARLGGAVKKSVFVEIVRLLIVLVFTAGGYAIAARYGAALVGATFGAAIGYVCGGILGRFLRELLGVVEAQTTNLSAGEILAGSVGALVMGLLAALVGVSAIGLLPAPWGWPVFGLIVWMGVHAGFRIAGQKSSEMLSIAGLSERSSNGPTGSPTRDAVLIDTSVLIDGRLLRLAQTGFLHRNLLVPCFVLDELQSLADSRNTKVRRKGRIGLESLEAIRRDTRLCVHVSEEEIPEIEAVDAKLVALATRLSVSLLTNDEALSRVAEIRGVHCMSLDRLAKSLSAVRTPGEVVSVTILKEGQEKGEGIGFLEDGSMVVVADAAERVGQELEVRITGSATTAHGRIFFASPTEP
jgi:uncharacterized protein YacL